MVNHVEHPVLIEARKIWPKVTPITMYRINDKDGKQNYMTIGRLESRVTFQKMKVIERWLRSNRRVANLRWSKTTTSMYFTIANVDFRISDHNPNKAYSGYGIILNWKADPIEIIQQIIYLSWTP